MKKTYTVNISGIIFHIDEDAYERLNNYLSRIKQHFASSDGKDEIISDIESRIAEMFKEKISEGKEVIILEDVQEMIEIMGEPKQFDDETEEGNQEQSTSEEQSYKRRRLYRDPDHRMLGGVCSGIAAYFNLDQVWVRIFFLILLFTGFGVLIYLALWIVIPLAQTTAEKLEMKGERVNISNIEKSIHEEVDHLKSKLNDLKNEAKDTFRKKKEDGELSKLSSFFGQIGHYFLKTILLIIGIAFVIAGVSALVGILVAVFAKGNFYISEAEGYIDYSFLDTLQFFAQTPTDGVLALIGLGLLIGIPLLSIIYGGFKLILGIRVKSRIISISLVSLWVLGLILTAAISIRTWNNYSYEDYMLDKKAAPKNINKEFTIKSTDVPKRFIHNSEIHTIDNWHIEAKNKKVYHLTREPHIKLYPSNSDSIIVKAYKIARGKDELSTESRLEAIEFNYTLTDSTLIFDDRYSIDQLSNWGFQRVKIKVYIPEDIKVKITDEAEHLIRHNHYYYDVIGEDCEDIIEEIEEIEEEFEDIREKIEDDRDDD